MAKPAPTYDLMLLLDPAADEDRRTKILSDVQALIGREGGEVVSDNDYGVRQTAYEVRKKAEAQYHLVQFHGSRELLATIDRTLRITDGVQRFRVIKLAAGVGAPPDLTAPAQAVPVPEDEQQAAPAAQ